MAEDYYSILGVSKSSTDADIKSAYRKMAMKYHPDKNADDKNAEQKFKEINEAYDTLKDPQKRQMYDQVGHGGYKQHAQGGGFGGGGFGGGRGGNPFGDDINDMFNDVFSQMFGGGARQKTTRRGSDVRYDMRLSLEEAFGGVEKNLKVQIQGKCDTCKGTGAEGSVVEESTCTGCNGAGVVFANRGFMRVQTVCNRCGGTGSVIKNPCRTCSGNGRTLKEKNITANIPAGVDSGMRVRLAGEGEAGDRGAPPGDLYIFITVSAHKRFKRDGDDLFAPLSLNMVDAALGTIEEIETIDNTKIEVKVPAGTDSGKRLRVSGKGMPVVNSKKRGDLYIDINVETPKDITLEQRKILEEFKNAGKSKAHPFKGIFS